jgi:four helix bundle protein
MWSSKGNRQAPPCRSTDFGLRTPDPARAPCVLGQTGWDSDAASRPAGGTARNVCLALSISRDPNKLDAFKLADELAVLVYHETRPWPPADREGIRFQLRRVAISAAVNVIEGCARRSERDYARFIDISLGSASETMYLIDLSNRIGLIADEAHQRCRNLSSRVVRARQKLLDAIEAFPPNESSAAPSQAGQTRRKGLEARRDPKFGARGPQSRRSQSHSQRRCPGQA